MLATTGDKHLPKTEGKRPKTSATTDYCAKLQQWMWQYYWGGSHCHWAPASASPFLRSFPSPSSPETSLRVDHHPLDRPDWSSLPYPLSFPASFPRVEAESSPAATRTRGVDARPAQQQSGPPARAGREYRIPSPLQRVLAETVDFVILFCVKATVVLWIMHLTGMKDIAKFITQFIVEEIDENTTLEDLQKMMAVALVYRVLVCVYEAICIWGAGGATPGKFLLGLRVVTCDTSTLVQPNHVLVVPASNVSLSASTVRALNKNFSIAFLFPVFITLLFFQHNRAVYDVVAGTIVVQHREGR